jgi:hypothetical protein
MQPVGANSPFIYCREDDFSEFKSLLMQRDFDALYLKIKKNPSLLQLSFRKTIHKDIEDTKGCSLFWLIIHYLINTDSTIDGRKCLDLVCKLIELDPELKFETSAGKIDSSGIFWYILRMGDCEEKTKLLRYLLLLGLKMEEDLEHKDKLEDLRASMKAEFLTVFNLRHQNQLFLECPLEIVKHIAFDFIFLHYPGLINWPQDVLEKKIAKFFGYI